MKLSLPLILLITVTLCESNRLACQIFDSSKRSLQQYCDNFNGSKPENCVSDTNAAIESSHVNHLKISGCEPEIVLKSIERFQKNIRALDISHSGYKNLDWFNLTLDQLQIFNASHNGLRYVSWTFFRKLPEIVEVDLSYNKLKKDLELSSIPKLQKVHLANNKITILNMEEFPLHSLNYIDLKNNNIRIIFYVAYERYKNLKELHLEGNPVFEINCMFLEGMFLARPASLFLSWRDVQSFSGFCQDKRIRILRINDTSDGIFITSNGAYEMRCSGKCFENMNLFKAGKNNFENVNDVIQNIGSSIFSLDLSGNFIGELDANALDQFVHLSDLNLSETNLTCFDFNMTWSKRSITYGVDISNNNLKELRNIPSLRNYNFEKLIIGGNQIENVYEIIENLNPSIEHLDLSENYVGKLNDTTFQKLTELQQLSLRKTNLILPDSNPFESLQNLKVLDLSHNNFEHFDFSILSATLYKLEELRLADCRIKDIFVFETVIQYLGPNLKKLDISENAVHGSIDYLSFDLFKNLSALYDLNISNNKLKTVDFKSLPFDDIALNLEDNDLNELTNLRKKHRRWMTLKPANNQFPCDYLQQLGKDYDAEIYLEGDSWKQKPDRDCHATTQSGISGFLSSFHEKIKFW